MTPKSWEGEDTGMLVRTSQQRSFSIHLFNHSSNNFKALYGPSTGNTNVSKREFYTFQSLLSPGRETQDTSDCGKRDQHQD